MQTKLTLVGQWQEAGWVAVEIYLQVQVRAQIPLGSQQPPGPEVLIYLLMQERNKKRPAQEILGGNLQVLHDQLTTLAQPALLM